MVINFCYTHTCRRAHTHICIHTSIYIYIYRCMYAYMGVCTPAYRCMYAYMGVCTPACVCVCIYIYIYVYKLYDIYFHGHSGQKLAFFSVAPNNCQPPFTSSVTDFLAWKTRPSLCTTKNIFDLKPGYFLPNKCILNKSTQSLTVFHYILHNQFVNLIANVRRSMTVNRIYEL